MLPFDLANLCIFIVANVRSTHCGSSSHHDVWGGMSSVL